MPARSVTVATQPSSSLALLKMSRMRSGDDRGAQDIDRSWRRVLTGTLMLNTGRLRQRCRGTKLETRGLPVSMTSRQSLAEIGGKRRPTATRVLSNLLARRAGEEEMVAADLLRRHRLAVERLEVAVGQRRRGGEGLERRGRGGKLTIDGGGDSARRHR